MMMMMINDWHRTLSHHLSYLKFNVRLRILPIPFNALVFNPSHVEETFVGNFDFSSLGSVKAILPNFVRVLYARIANAAAASEARSRHRFC